MLLHPMGIFLLMSIRESSNVVLLFFRQSPPEDSLPALPTACPHCSLACSLGTVREGGNLARNSWILPQSYGQGGSGHTRVRQTQLSLLSSPTLTFQYDFYFPCNTLSATPIPSSVPAISLFHYNEGRDSLVFTEQEMSSRSSTDSASAGAVWWQGYVSWPKHLPRERQARAWREQLSWIRNDRHRWALIRQNQGQVYFSHSFLY